MERLKALTIIVVKRNSSGALDNIARGERRTFNYTQIVRGGTPAPRAECRPAIPCRGRQFDRVKTDEMAFSPAAGCTPAPVHESIGLGARPAAPRSEPVHSRTPAHRI